MDARMTADPRVALATLVAGAMFLSPSHLDSYSPSIGSAADGSGLSRVGSVAFSESALAPALQASAQGSAVAIGKGCTTAWYIDEDCDGYGPGVRSSGTYGYNQLGVGDKPDANDSNANINTVASVVAAYGSGGTLSNAQLKTFLATRGYNVEDVFYIATNGNNATGQANNPNAPFATYIGVHNLTDAGDVVIYRTGTYDNPDIGTGAPVLRSGTSGDPFVVMSMPGEVVHFTTNSNRTFNTAAIGGPGAAWVIIDGFTVNNSGSDPSLGTAWSCSGTQNTIIRNIETQRFAYISCIEGHDNLTVERNVIHHQAQHGLYMGANATESSNIVVQDSIFYANGWDNNLQNLSNTYGGHQFNGRCNGCTWTRNISHTNSGWGLSLIQGVHNSTISNNLLFNNGTAGVVMHIYPGSCQYIGGSVGEFICPYDTNNNLFVNNTIWVGTHRGDGAYGVGATTFPEGFPAILIARNTRQCVENGVAVPEVNCTMEQTFRNNVFIVTNGPVWRFDQRIEADRWAQNSVYENNIVYKSNGTTNFLRIQRCDISVCSSGSPTDYTFSTFQSTFTGGSTNGNGDPKFVRANTTEYASPQLFDFRLLSTSPAIDFASATGVPARDIRQVLRISPHDAGAYQYGGEGSTSPPQAPTNLRIIR